MSKESPIYAQLYVYDRKSLLPALLRSFIALCGDSGIWNLTGLSKDGVKQIKKSTSLTEIFGKIATAFPDGFNQLEIVGTGSNKTLAKQIPKTKITYMPSPLNKDWAPIGNNLSPDQYTRPTWLMLMSLSTRESPASMRVKRQASFLSIEVANLDGPLGVSRKRLSQLFDGMIQTIGEEYTKGYIGYIDPWPVVTAATVMGGQKDQMERMDVYFDKPHLVVFGPSAILQKFADDTAASVSKLDVTSEAIGSATVVAFKDLEEASKAYLPEWHFRNP